MARMPDASSANGCPICGSLAYPADIDIVHIDEAWGAAEHSYSYQIKQGDTIRILFNCACIVGGLWWRETYVLAPDGENLVWGYVPYDETLLREANNRDHKE